MHGTSLGIFSVHVQRPRTTKFHPNRLNPAELWRHIDLPRWRLRRGHSDFVFGYFAQLEKSKSTCIANFGGISRYTVEILLLLISSTKCPPCWNSTSGFDFHIRIIIAVTRCISLPNLPQLSYRYRYSRWRPRDRISTSGFVSCDLAHFGRSISTCRPNFGQISLSTAENEIITILGFLKQTSAMLKFYFRFRLSRLHHHRHVILHLPNKFRPNLRRVCGGLMTSWRFSRWQPSAILYFLNGNCRPPTKCKWGSHVGPQISDLLFRKYCYLYDARFWLKISYLRGCVRRACAESGVN